MSDGKDFVTVVDSNVKKTPRRIAFVTRRTSAQGVRPVRGTSIGHM